MTIPKVYSPKDIEDKWYQNWIQKNSFAPNLEAPKSSFCVLMPPPNVTGILHMGHALDATTQDAIIRFRRMKGHKTLFIPGYDHAGISCQAVVEKKIYKEEKKTRFDLGKEEFLKRIWQWKEENGNDIVEQQKKLGISCDWNYHTFTMDEIPNRAIRKVFVSLYKEGLIYQSDYIVNWDPILQSAISDAEVEHKEVSGNFYFIKYFIEGTDDFLTVATTRPETLFGDTALAVHPEDERYKHLIGKNVSLPLAKRLIPIIADEYVDKEKGTGCLKVTPGHDFNDFEIGKRHNLPIINILQKNGKLGENTPTQYQGLSTSKAREKIKEELEENNLLIKVESIIHQVGHGERSGDIVEPMVSKQWFVSTSKMAKVALEAVEDGSTTFFPKGWENTYFAWLKEPKDWCISRQLWWGHQIPVFYCSSCDHQWADENDAKECVNCTSSAITQDQDVLDTWFSSGLWPLTTLGWPDKKAMEEKKFDLFYPTQTLVTGFDIIFFWVARMMMMCLKETKQVPFSDVYIHAIVRDKQGRKMSKSLGNGINPLDLIDQYGTDALRFALASDAGYNRTINLDVDRIEGYRNFMNKLWNAFRFTEPYLAKAQNTLPPLNELTHQDKWILAELNLVKKTMNEEMEKYRFDEASSAIYSFVYDKFCSWYIEFSKPIFAGEDDQAATIRASVLKYVFKEILALLHPITPFITEEIWSYLDTEYLIAQKYPEYESDLNFSDDRTYMNYFIDYITALRNSRAALNIKPKEEIDTIFYTDNSVIAEYLYQNRVFLHSLAKVKKGTIYAKSTPDRPAKATLSALEFGELYLLHNFTVDNSAQIQKIETELKKMQDELSRVEQKLSNSSFMEKAPEHVTNEIKNKKIVFVEKIEMLTKQLASL